MWAETLNLADVAAYSVGGTIHVIVNNLLGFTTEPREYQSSRFASSLAKRQAVPIFHVNGEDPDAVVRVGQIALEYRSAFASDVVVDVIGYRRHGHSEVDDPTITQPLLYAKIKDHAQLWQIYAKEIGADPSADCHGRAQRTGGRAPGRKRDAEKAARCAGCPRTGRPTSGGGTTAPTKWTRESRRRNSGKSRIY